MNTETLCIKSITDAADLTAQQNIDADIILPDYYDTIGRILKSEITPVIEAVTVSGDKISIAGIAKLYDTPVTVIGQNKGKNTKENIEKNFGMTNPEGYRKALRLMKQAEKFNRPVITFIDTPGAYPGIGAEERGQRRSNCEKYI